MEQVEDHWQEVPYHCVFGSMAMKCCLSDELSSHFHRQTADNPNHLSPFLQIVFFVLSLEKHFLALTSGTRVPSVYSFVGFVSIRRLVDV